MTIVSAYGKISKNVTFAHAYAAKSAGLWSWENDYSKALTCSCYLKNKLTCSFETDFYIKTQLAKLFETIITLQIFYFILNYIKYLKKLHDMF